MKKTKEETERYIYKETHKERKRRRWWKVRKGQRKEERETRFENWQQKSLVLIIWGTDHPAPRCQDTEGH